MVQIFGHHVALDGMCRVIVRRLDDFMFRCVMTDQKHTTGNTVPFPFIVPSIRQYFYQKSSTTVVNRKESYDKSRSHYREERVVSQTRNGQKIGRRGQINRHLETGQQTLLITKRPNNMQLYLSLFNFIPLSLPLNKRNSVISNWVNDKRPEVYKGFIIKSGRQ